MTQRHDAPMESPLTRAYAFARYTALLGGVGGFAVALPLWLFTGRFPLSLVVGAALFGLVGGFLVGLVLREGVGGLVEFATGGSRGRARPEHSRPQALVARGAYREAVDEYVAAAEFDPRDPEPLIQAARVLRDHLGEHEEAAAWLHRALRIEGIGAQAEASAVRELVDLCEGPLGTPTRALPELARIAEKHAGTRTGEWAGRRLAALRTRAWEDVKGAE